MLLQRSNMRYISFAILGKRIKSIKKFLLDPDVPKRKKLLVIFGIIYLLMPIDLIPVTVLGFGIIDDIVLWLFILIHLSDELDKYWKESEYGPAEEARVDPKKEYKGKAIIETTGREIDDDE
jgi:uncharacterized membrane protein YkvA (DUF1232 family)